MVWAVDLDHDCSLRCDLVRLDEDVDRQATSHTLVSVRDIELVQGAGDIVLQPRASGGHQCVLNVSSGADFDQRRRVAEFGENIGLLEPQAKED